MAAVVLIEHLWAIPLRDKIIEAGGVPWPTSGSIPRIWSRSARCWGRERVPRPEVEQAGSGMATRLVHPNGTMTAAPSSRWIGGTSEGGAWLAGYVVFAFFENGGTADKAARELEAWARRTRHIDLDAVGVLVRDDRGAVKTQKLGPRAGRSGAGIGLVLGLIAAVPAGEPSLVHARAGMTGGRGLLESLVPRGPGPSPEETGWIADQLDTGRAAVGVLAASEEADLVAAKLERLGGQTKLHEVDGIEAAEA